MSEFTGVAGAELAGCNAVTAAEIEHRYGPGVLQKSQGRTERGK